MWWTRRSTLEIAIPFLIKARDPSLRAWKRMGLNVDLEDAKQSILAITSMESEREGEARRIICPVVEVFSSSPKDERKVHFACKIQWATQDAPARGGDQEEKGGP